MIVIVWALLIPIAAYPLAWLIAAAGMPRPESAYIGIAFGLALAATARWSLTLVARWMGRGARRG